MFKVIFSYARESSLVFNKNCKLFSACQCNFSSFILFYVLNCLSQSCHLSLVTRLANRWLTSLVKETTGPHTSVIIAAVLSTTMAACTSTLYPTSPITESLATTKDRPSFTEGPVSRLSDASPSDTEAMSTTKNPSLPTESSASHLSDLFPSTAEPLSLINDTAPSIAQVMNTTKVSPVSSIDPLINWNGTLYSITDALATQYDSSMPIANPTTFSSTMNILATTPDSSLPTVDPLSLWPNPSSFVVSITCRDHLAKTTGFRACHLMDANRERPACEVREQSDTRVLFSVGSISGMTQVFIARNYYCTLWEINTYVLKLCELMSTRDEYTGVGWCELYEHMHTSVLISYGPLTRYAKLHVAI